MKRFPRMIYARIRGDTSCNVNWLWITTLTLLFVIGFELVITHGSTADLDLTFDTAAAALDTAIYRYNNVDTFYERLVGSTDIVFNLSGGIPTCSNCGDLGAYACSNTDVGYWPKNGFQFKDPIPRGQTLLQVEVTTRGAYECDSRAFRQDFWIGLNSQPDLGRMEDVRVDRHHQPCTCTECDGDRSICRRIPRGIPGYRYGGMNFLFVNTTVAMCLSTITMRLSYGQPSPNVSNPIPLATVPIVQGMIPVAGACVKSTGQAIYQDFPLNDPLPRGAILTNVHVSISGILCSGSSRSSTFAGLFQMGDASFDLQFNITDSTSNCLFRSTCDPMAVNTSLTYQVGWPGYYYRQMNTARIWILPLTPIFSLTWCANYADLEFTFYQKGFESESQVVNVRV